MFLAWAWSYVSCRPLIGFTPRRSSDDFDRRITAASFWSDGNWCRTAFCTSQAQDVRSPWRPRHRPEFAQKRKASDRELAAISWRAGHRARCPFRLRLGEWTRRRSRQRATRRSCCRVAEKISRCPWRFCYSYFAGACATKTQLWVRLILSREAAIWLSTAPKIRRDHDNFSISPRCDLFCLTTPSLIFHHTTACTHFRIFALARYPPHTATTVYPTYKQI